MDKVTKCISKLKPDADLIVEDCPLSDCINAPIAKEELICAIKKLKDNKSIGTDGLPSEFYRYANNLLDSPLLALFNYVFETGIYPDAWSTGIVHPIYKKNERFNPDNYRKITVQPALGKLFDSILNNRLNYIKSTLKIEDPLQFGFREKHGAVDNAFILNTLIDISKTNKQTFYVCFIDFHAAFDNIDRAALLFKMRQQGIKGKFFNILRDMLSKSKTTVRWNNEYGKLIDNLRGVLQGNVSSPALFKLFLEDLSNYLHKDYGVRIGEIELAHMLLLCTQDILPIFDLM